MSKHEPIELKMSFHEHYKAMWPFVKPYTFRALLAILISIPIGALDSVVALSLKPYMDVVMVEKSVSQTWYIPFLIIIFLVEKIKNLLFKTAKNQPQFYYRYFLPFIKKI